MAALLTDAPVQSVLLWFERWSHFAVASSPWSSSLTWDSAAVLKGTATPADTMKFLATTLILCHSVVFYSMGMLYTVISWIFTDEQLAPWRFQGLRKVERSLLIQCLVYVTCFHIVISYAMYNYSTPPLFQNGFFGKPGQNLLQTVPTLPALIGQLVVCAACTDFLFFWGHKFLHDVPFLYQHVHKVHHRFTVTCSFACEYAHPVELLFGNILPVVSGPLFCKMHPVVWFIWMMIAMYSTCTGHSGFWYPSAIAGWHDFHHEFHNKGQYGGLPFWDHLLGTAAAWDAARAKGLPVYHYQTKRSAFLSSSSASPSPSPSPDRASNNKKRSSSNKKTNKKK